MERLDAEYVLPLRWERATPFDELAAYLNRLREWIDVTVVDGSDPDAFEEHARRMPEGVRHFAPVAWPGRNGKVAGVMTGVRRSRHERVVLADDDIRYTPETLRAVVELLEGADLVRPQNHFVRYPWHARWDTARSLINRSLGSDYPGTFAVRRSALLGAGGYDGDVLFENLQLIRTIRAWGGTEVRANGLFVGRMPPTAEHFFGQRVRQAYDDFAQPGRLVAELALLPLLIALARRPATLTALFIGACALAEAGRRAQGGRSVYPATSALWAPLWLLERSVCVWVAVVERLRGGVRYAGQRMPRAGTSVAVITRQLTSRLEAS